MKYIIDIERNKERPVNILLLPKNLPLILSGTKSPNQLFHAGSTIEDEIQ